MFSNMEKEFCRSMDTLHFSPEDKERIVGKIIQCQNKTKKREDINMRKSTLPKAAAVAAACLLLTGGTVFAASKIISYEAGSNGYYDYSSVSEMNEASSDAQEKTDITMPEFPDSIGGSYTFDGGNTVYVSGKDEAGNTMDNWDDLRAVYKNAEGGIVNLTLSCKMPDEEDRIPTETRVIDGINVTFNYDEYLVLPDEDEPLDAAVQERKDNDEHFFVSYGGDNETFFFSSASFVKDGVHYLIYTNDNVSADDLFSMAEELISK